MSELRPEVLRQILGAVESGEQHTTSSFGEGDPNNKQLNRPNPKKHYLRLPFFDLIHGTNRSPKHGRRHI